MWKFRLFTREKKILYHIYMKSAIGSFRFKKVYILSIVAAFVIGFILHDVITAVYADAVNCDVNQDARCDISDYSSFVGALVRDFGTTPSVTVTMTQTPSPTSGNGTPTATPTGPSVPAAFHPADPDLVAYVPFDETSGLVSNKNTQTTIRFAPVGNPTYGVAGKSGKGVKVGSFANHFCSVNTAGTACGDNDALDFTGNYTMGAWVKPDSVGGLNYFFRKWEQDKGAYQFFLNKTSFILNLSHPWPDWRSFKGPDGLNDIGRSYRIAKGSGIKAGAWNFVVVARNTATPNYGLFVNGKRVNSENGVVVEADGGKVTSVMRNDNQNSQDPLRIGEFSGVMDEFFAYKRALSAEEILALYNATK